MTVSTSLLAYQDCIAYMDKGIADPKGIRFKVESIEEATYQRTRIHYARKLHRDENAKTYEPGHKMHGRSEYDALVCRIKNVDGDIYIYLERTDFEPTDAESLSDIPQIAHEPVRMIAAPVRVEVPVQDIVESIVRRRV